MTYQGYKSGLQVRVLVRVTSHLSEVLIKLSGVHVRGACQGQVRCHLKT